MTALPASPRILDVTPSLSKSSAVLGDGRNGQRLLGSIIVQNTAQRNNEAFLKIVDFTDQFFPTAELKILFRAMKLVHDDGLNVEYDSVIDRLKKMENKKEPGHFAIEQLTEDQLQQICAIDGSNIEMLIELVKGEYIRRHDAAAALEKHKWALDSSIPLDAYLEKADTQNTENMRLYASLRGSRAQTMTEGMRDVEAQIARTQAEPGGAAFMYHTGIQSLTDLMSGGLEKGLVYIFGGRPGDGKSIMLQTIATSVMNQGGRPFILSLEMTPDKFWQRILVAECGIELDRIKSGDMSKDERARLTECLARLQAHKMGEHFLIEYMRLPTLAQMRTKVAQEAYGRGVDVLLLDYASFRKVTLPNDKLPPNQMQMQVSQWLVSIAKEFHIPVVSAAQMSRDIDKRGGDPILSDLEQTIAMEQDADFIGLFKEDEVKVSGVDYTVTNCHVVKQREGKTGVIPLKARKHLFKFEDMRS